MLSRRSFLLNTAAFSAAPALSFAAERAPITLKLQRRVIEVSGKPASVYAINRTDGVVGLEADQGSRFRVRVENGLSEPSLLHWHGLAPPSDQDGVPGLSGPAIQPGGAAEYDFPLTFGGTYFMHSHYGFQEQQLMAAPLIINDRKRYPDWQQVVVMLSDFSFRSPQEIYAALTSGKKSCISGRHGRHAHGRHTNGRNGDGRDRDGPSGYGFDDANGRQRRRRKADAEGGFERCRLRRLSRQ